MEIIKRNPNSPKRGPEGPQGVGVKDITKKGDGILISLTNGKDYFIDDVRGANGSDGAPGNSPNIDSIVAEVMSRITLPRDGVSPDFDEIVEAVVEKIPKPKDGVSPDFQKVVETVLSKIPVPKDGISPDPDWIIKQVLSKIPAPKDGISPDFNKVVDALEERIPKPKDGISPDPELIAKNVLSRIKVPKDGRDAPFSDWVKNHSIKGFTNKEKPTNQVFEIRLEEGGVFGISVLMVGKGSNGINAFYGVKHCMFIRKNGKITKADQDIIDFVPRRTNHKLNFEIASIGDIVKIEAVGLAEEEMIWHGDIRIAQV